MANLLARSAENVFWLARYMERVENQARILDVTETFARDQGGRNWRSVVDINADEANFFAKHKTVDARSVCDFYLLDADNPTSIPFAIQAAHQNARALRPIMSIELWAQLNVLRYRLRGLKPADIGHMRLSKLCTEIREACQTHAGIVEGTFCRDEAWYFYWLGKHLERADQTTRLLDIKYHLLLPSPDSVGSALDLNQWNALLRAAAGYQAFRRVCTSRMTPSAVVGFLLFSGSFPRSIGLCLKQIDYLLSELRTRYQLSGGREAMETLDELRAVFGEQTVDGVIAAGLHEFLDWMQRKLALVGREIAQGFFGESYRPPRRLSA